MNRVGKVVLVEIPDSYDKKLKYVRKGEIKPPYNPPIRDLGEARLPRDTFQLRRKQQRNSSRMVR